MFEELENLGVNVELGMSYCMDDEDFYSEVLEEYVNSNKLDELENYYSSRDWANYQIRIHAVKSTSLNIGAETLSAKALALETACKEKNEAYILDKHAECMRDYKKVLEAINSL